MNTMDLEKQGYAIDDLMSRSSWTFDPREYDAGASM